MAIPFTLLTDFLNDEAIDGRVATFANLPAAASNTGKLYVVEQDSGVVFINKKRAGLYLSDGANWNRLAENASFLRTDASSGSDNRLIKSNGTGGNGAQETGISVDDSNNITGVGTMTTGGHTATGTIDFGGADDFELPNGTAPTVDTNGQMAVDTSVTDWSHGIVKYYSGEELGVVAMPNDQFTSPTDGYVVAYNATNDEFELVAQSAGVSDGDKGDITVSGSGSTWTIDAPTNVDPAADDEILIKDTSDSNNTKSVTISDMFNLATYEANATTSTITLTAADRGKIIKLTNSSSSHNIFLPPVSEGLVLGLVVDSTSETIYHWVYAESGSGHTINNHSSGVALDAKGGLTLFYSDGTQWFSLRCYADPYGLSAATPVSNDRFPFQQQSGGYNTKYVTLSSLATAITGSANGIEAIQDLAGAMWSSNTETSATVTYQDADGTIDIDASLVLDTTPQLGGNLDVNGSKIISASNGNIDIEPNGTGNVLLGNFTFDADQSVGAGQDNYVLTYDNATGLISLEAASGGGADTALSNLASVAINTSLISDTDITDDLGSQAIRWNNAYVATVSTGDTAADTLKLRGYDVDGATYVDVLTITANNTVTADLDSSVTIGGNAILDATSTSGAFTTLSSLTTVGALDSGSITANFGAIDNGTSNITTGGILKVDVDGTALNAAGSVTVGAGNDAGMFFNGTDLIVRTDGVGASGIVLDSEDDTVEIQGSGVTQATFSTSGLNIVAGDAYSIGGTSVLNATTLGSGVTASSLTSVGTISSGTWQATDVGVAYGGTGRSSHTAYAVLCGGTTTTGAQQSVASVGTSGQVLTSNGAGALPTFQDAAGGGTGTGKVIALGMILR